MIICPWKDIMRYAPIVPGLEEAFEKVNALTSLEPATYPLENGRFIVMSGNTVSTVGGTCEAHGQYLDIQYIVKGQEVMGWAPLDTLTVAEEFSAEKDVGFYSGHCEFIRIAEGNCYVVFPEDGHMPTRYLEESNEYTKIVVKLKV